MPKLFNYQIGNTQRKLDAIKNSNYLPNSVNPNENNIMKNIINPMVPNINPNLNAMASPATKNLNVNMMIDNTNNILANTNNNFNQSGKNPPGWLSQNNLAMNNQSGFNRGGNVMPRNTLTSTNIVLNNK